MFDSPLVSSAWLQKHLTDPSLKVLDCAVAGQPNKDGTYTFLSQREAWLEGHIPNSVYVDVPEQLSDKSQDIGLMMPAPEDFAAIMKAIGIGDGTNVVLYDRGNHAWATRVWWMLRVCGFDNAAVLNGGWKKWQAEGREVATGEFEFPKAENFSLSCRPELMVDKDKVLSCLGKEEIMLLHSLPLPAFTGEVTPYARPGRIPGSKNLYCETLLDPNSNCYLDLDTIRSRFAATGALEAKEVIAYCGGGIAASSNAFVLSLLGLENVAIYDGSLSQWATDPDLPMETG